MHSQRQSQSQSQVVQLVHQLRVFRVRYRAVIMKAEAAAGVKHGRRHLDGACKIVVHVGKLVGELFNVLERHARMGVIVHNAVSNWRESTRTRPLRCEVELAVGRVSDDVVNNKAGRRVVCPPIVNLKQPRLLAAQQAHNNKLGVVFRPHIFVCQRKAFLHLRHFFMLENLQLCLRHALSEHHHRARHNAVVSSRVLVCGEGDHSRQRVIDGAARLGLVRDAEVLRHAGIDRPCHAQPRPPTVE
mmetsp:Transcript_47712/g.123726  ORF Transcript_47712/g.123726 Transcript_47712/m.123726 type:complete len:244 (+) Transcript_47712:173-904(+)